MKYHLFAHNDKNFVKVGDTVEQERCIFCNKVIPKERYAHARRGKGHLKILKYCSGECIKRKWFQENSNRGLSLLNSSTHKGRHYELIAKTLLKDSKDCNEEGFRNKGFDIIWQNKRIDVKAKEFSKRGFWSFSRENNNCDYYFLICLKENNIYKMLLIPEAEMGRSGISLGLKSKFDKYIYENN